MGEVTLTARQKFLVQTAIVQLVEKISSQTDSVINIIGEDMHPKVQQLMDDLGDINLLLQLSDKVTLLRKE